MPKVVLPTGFGVMGMNEYLEGNEMNELREYVKSLTRQKIASLKEIIEEYEKPPKCPRCGNDILIKDKTWKTEVKDFSEMIVFRSTLECARCQILITGRDPGDAENKWREMYNGCI